MKLNRFFFSVLLILACCCVFLGRAQEDKGKSFRLPKWLRVFSKGPHPDDDPYEGREFFTHVDNVLQGGTIGVEVNMKKQVGKLNKWWDKVKRYLPFMRSFRKRSRPEGREIEDFFPTEGARIDPRKTSFRFSSDRLRAPSS